MGPGIWQKLDKLERLGQKIRNSSSLTQQKTFLLIQLAVSRAAKAFVKPRLKYLHSAFRISDMDVLALASK